MNKYIKYIIWLVVVAYFAIALTFVSKSFKSVLCQKINVNIKDSVERKFVCAQDIVELFKITDTKIWGYNLNEISFYDVENLISENIPMVKTVNVYSDVNGLLNIDITQREPIVRVYNKTKNSYYIGSDGNLLPLSKHFSAPVIVASGDIYQSFIGKVPVYIDSVVGKSNVKNSVLEDVYKLGKRIFSDKLLSKQIEQIYVNNGEFELYPRVGMQRIILGDLSNLDEKIFKLKVIYYKGFSNLGWNKYNQINLKYSNQVICRKK